jgi:hypothetical protein
MFLLDILLHHPPHLDYTAPLFKEQARGEGLSRNQGTISLTGVALTLLFFRLAYSLRSRAGDHARASLLPDPNRGIRPVS